MRVGNPQNVGGMVVIATALSVYKSIKDGNSKGIVKIIFANVALFGALTIVGQFLSWDLAIGLAIVYLLNAVLYDGGELINWFAKLVS